MSGSEKPTNPSAGAAAGDAATVTKTAQVNLAHVRPYGDTVDDGQVQVSFTLPVPNGEEAREAARQLMTKMGLEDPAISAQVDLHEGFTFFVGYGRCRHAVDYSAIRVPKVQLQKMGFYEVNQFIVKSIGRKVVVLGACTGTDAHTVGIDAIMNMKGFSGEYGLERYPEMDAYNLGSQVSNEELVRQALRYNADALLVSQVVTQKKVHIHNLAQLLDLLEAEGLRQQLVVVCGGPRITHKAAMELGFDAGFGPGTVASDVASFIVQEIVRRGLKTRPALGGTGCAR